ncbi:MAG: MFS transporter [Kiritimatiellaeota bacterium]|nr:MFS transporter [Kiritimatiellota bacterium]
MRESKVFLARSGAMAFMFYTAFWGMASGCFMALVNNYLVEIHGYTTADRGNLEMVRELPGLLLVFLLAPLARVPDWKVLRISAVIAMLGVSSICLTGNSLLVAFFIVVWSLGEHLHMPIRSTVAMSTARPGMGGRALGIYSSFSNGGTLLGMLFVFFLFWAGNRFFAGTPSVRLYDVAWMATGALALICALATFSSTVPQQISKRPRLYFHRKYRIFYGLELFYGARKQIFITFGPFVLIRVYGVDVKGMALLFCLSAVINMMVAPVVGRIIDRLGYRLVMIWDTIILVVVCVLYGFADDFFPKEIALWVVCANFLFDAMISTTSMATSLYVKDISRDSDEIAATLTTGISMNHLISIIIAPLGGLIWECLGVGTLFVFSAVMGLANSCVAALLPRKQGGG